MAVLNGLKIFIAKVSSKDRTTRAAKADRYFSSRTFYLRDIASDAPAGTQAIGILREINGLGLSMGEVVAEDKYGSITLDVTRGTTSFDKRFYDVFERDTIIHQSIVLYSLEVPEESLNGAQAGTGTIADWRIEFAGEMTDCKINTREKKLTISIKTKALSDESPNYQIIRANFPNSSDEASGAFLPIIFGQTTVPLTFLRSGTSDPDTLAGLTADQIAYFDFAIGTQLTNSDTNKRYLLGSIVNRYTQAADGKFYALELPSSTAGFGFTPFEPFKLTTPLVLPAASAQYGSESARLLLPGSPKNYLVTSALGYWQVNRSSGTPLTPKLKISVYDKNISSPLPSNEIQSGSAAFTKAMLFSASPSLPVMMAATFNTPVFFVTASKGYFIAGMVNDESQASTLSGGLPTDYWQVITSSDIGARITKDRTTAKEGWIALADSNIYALSPVVATRELIPDTSQAYLFERIREIYWNGVTLTSFTVSSGVDVTAASAQDICDLSKLNLVYEVEGLKTQNTFLTGVSDQLITRADHIVKLLWLLSYGSLSGLDVSIFNPGGYVQNLDGCTNGKQGLREILLEVLENSACKLVPRDGGNTVALWAYGVPQSVVATISEADATLDDIEIAGQDRIVNRVRANYARSAIPLNSTAQQQGENNFAASVQADDPISQELYGIRDLESSFIELRYVKSAIAAERWANYKIAQYARERMYVTFTVPFWKSNYRMIDLMDKVRFSHIDNPSYLGSASSADEPPLTTEGIDEGLDYNLGDPWRRAQQYEMRILGRIPKYSINAEEATITFRAVVLNNPNEIT